MKTEWMLALRYLRPRRSAVSVITLISLIGVMLGVAVLLIVLAVMTGFTDLMKEKLIETQAHLQVHPSGQDRISDPDEVVARLKKCGVEAAPVIQSAVMAQLGRRGIDPQLMLLGVRPEDLRKHMRFDTALRQGKLSLEKGEAIISTHQARRWGLSVGEKFLLHSPNRLTRLVRFKPEGGVELNPEHSVYLPNEFTVSGIYSFGKYDFDRSVLFAGLDDAADLVRIPWGAATAVYGWVRDPFRMEAETESARAALPLLRVSDWTEENARLLGVLQVEKRMMFFLLVFIVLVAAFSITNTLITSVYQKTREIGILKALGAGNGLVMKVFLLQGLLVGAIGGVLGTGFGLLVIAFRNELMQIVSRVSGQELFPKEFYFFDQLPAHVIPGDVVFVVLSAVVLCTAGALVPAVAAAKLDPAKALRYE